MLNSKEKAYVTIRLNLNRFILSSLLLTLIFTFFVTKISIANNFKETKETVAVNIETTNATEQVITQAELEIQNNTKDFTEKLPELPELPESSDRICNITETELELLLKLTEAEAGNQPLEGRAAVAAVVINRTKDPAFEEDSISEIIYAPKQFDVVCNNRINEVIPSEITKQAVELTLQGKDYSEGALYFYNPHISSSKNCRWLETKQTTTIIDEHTFKK